MNRPCARPVGVFTALVLSVWVLPLPTAGQSGIEGFASKVQEGFTDVKEAFGFIDADFPVHRDLGDAQPGDVLAADTGIEVWFPSPEALLVAAAGETFEAEDRHSDAPIEGRVTAAATFWRGPKIELTAIELLGRRHRLATRAGVFQGEPVQAFKLLTDVNVTKAWPMIEPVKVFFGIPFDRPFASAFALHGVAAFWAMAYLWWRVSTRKGWGKTTMRLQFLKRFWLHFYAASVVAIASGSWLVGHRLGISDPPLSLDWLAGGGFGLGLAFCGAWVSGLFGKAITPPGAPPDDLDRVGPVEDAPLSRLALADDPGVSDDW